jgi:hypothetical protein
MINLCDEKDCPLHPNYSQDLQNNLNEKINKYENSDLYNISNCSLNTLTSQPTTFTIGDNYVSIEEKGIKLKSHQIEAYLECFFCIHRNQYDMKQEIIIQKAKKLLEE